MKIFTLAAVLSLMLVASCISSSAQTTKKTFSNIQNMAAWTSCDVCSGSGGNGSTATHWQAPVQTTPALSGSSSQFFYGGTVKYSSALWWEQLGSNPQYSHFNYDLQFFITDITAPQALE